MFIYKFPVDFHSLRKSQDSKEAWLACCCLSSAVLPRSFPRLLSSPSRPLAFCILAHTPHYFLITPAFVSTGYTISTMLFSSPSHCPEDALLYKGISLSVLESSFLYFLAFPSEPGLGTPTLTLLFVVVN